MADYCRKHSCNNCIECALEKQTKEIVEAIRRGPETELSFIKILVHKIRLFFKGK